MGVEAASTPTVRCAERADLLAVLRIEKQSFPQPWTYDAFERFLGETGFLIADVAGTDTPVVGYVVADTIQNHGGPLGHVKDIAVHPDHRERGIGTRLLRAALDRLAGQGASAVKLEVRASNDTATTLYEDFGFEVHHTVPEYYADGEDARVMVRQLTG
ncbi:MAG: ribosomal protein S18-alanine N-acetyltransferase [Halobacteriaceae archaeon]